MSCLQLRIALVNWTSRHVGGLETYINRVVPILVDAGHALYFHHEHSGPDDRPRISAVDNLRSCAVDTAGRKAAMAQLREWRADVLFVQRVLDLEHQRELMTIAPAVFFAHDYNGCCISGTKTTTSPVIQPCKRPLGPACIVHFYPKRCGGLSPVTLARDYRRQREQQRALHRYQQIVVFSDHMRDEMVRQGIHSAHVHRLPPLSSVNPPLSTGTAAKVERFRPGARRLLYMGRIDRLKGCHVLIDALPSIVRTLGNPVELLVAGAGPFETACRQRAAQMTLLEPRATVCFLGWQSPDQCDALLGDTEVLVMPSLWPEPLGLSGLEAVDRGVPVAAFAVGGIPEWLIEGVNGALAPGDPPSAEGLARAVTHCLDTPSLREHIRHHTARSQPDDAHVNALVRVLAAASAASTPSAHGN